MKAFILLTGIALFTSGFISNEFDRSSTAVVTKAKPSNQHFNYFRAHRMANDASLNWSVGNPMAAASFVILFSYDGEYWYEVETIPATGAAVYRYRDASALPGTTHYKIVAVQKDLSTVESSVETVRIVKRG
ncbi:MAG TPA: hypothetical protein VFV46_04840 [Lacibacter sp.]|nr:hypothetical protein [Lacibacter sp.]